MSRTFDGTDDQILFSGGTDYDPGALSIAFVARRAVELTTHEIIMFERDASLTKFEIYIDSVDDRVRYGDGAANSGSVNVKLLIVDGWTFIAMTKATGTTTPRFHKYVYSTGTWTHDDGAAAVPNTNTNAINQIRIGSYVGPSDWFEGEIAWVSYWGANFTDAQVEQLAFNRPALWIQNPNGLWILDQDSTSMLVPDITGRGQNQSSIIGTSVYREAVPDWTYGHEVIHV